MIEVNSWKATGGESFKLKPVSDSRPNGNYEWSYNSPEKSIDNPLALDMLEIGKAVHLADRAFRRSLKLGQRGRRIAVRVPVLEPRVWKRAAPILEDLARFA